jgi:geranyl-CoA carboxylase beta subunit
MGAEQAATTMAIVMEEGARRKGVAPPEAAIAEMRARVIETFERQQSAFYTSGLMLDDGVIDPRDTRRVVALALSVCAEAERRTLRPLTFGVARM